MSLDLPQQDLRGGVVRPGVVVNPLGRQDPGSGRAAHHGAQQDDSLPDLDPVVVPVAEAALAAVKGKTIVALWMGTNFKHWTLETADGSCVAFASTTEGLVTASESDLPPAGTAWRFA